MKISLVACVSVFRCDILYCSIPVRLCETSIYCKCFNWFVPVPNLNRNEINSSLWFEMKIRNVCLSVWMATPVLHFKNQNILLFHKILLSKYFKLVVSNWILINSFRTTTVVVFSGYAKHYYKTSARIL